MADRYGRNHYSGRYKTQQVTCRRADGTTLVVLLFTKRQQWSFDEAHWADTQGLAFQQATHCYEATYGSRINK